MKKHLCTMYEKKIKCVLCMKKKKVCTMDEFFFCTINEFFFVPCTVAAFATKEKQRKYEACYQNVYKKRFLGFLLLLFLWYQVQGLGFGVQGLGFGVYDLGFVIFCYFFVVSGLGLRVQGLGLGVRDWGLGSRVQGLGFRVQGLGFRVQGLVCYYVLWYQVVKVYVKLNPKLNLNPKLVIFCGIRLSNSAQN